MSTKEEQSFQTSQDFENLSIFKPKTEKEISEFVKFCNKKNIPLEIKGLQSKKKLDEIFNLKELLI